MDPDPYSRPAALLLQDVAAAGLEPSFIITGLAVFSLLLIFSAFFSGSEVALFSLDGPARELLAESGDRASHRVLALLERPRQLLITILLYNTFVNVCAAILAALLTAHVAFAFGWSTSLTFAVEVVVLTFVLLVVSEITPKLIATRQSVAYSRRASVLLLPLHRLVRPVSALLARMTRFFHDRIHVDASPLSPDDLKAMAEIGEAHGTIEEEERELIHSIVEFGETSVREIMQSRLDVVALSATSTLDEALDVIRTSGYSRLPLYFDHLDRILGIIYAKDLLPYLNRREDAAGPGRAPDWTRLARPPLFVPLGKKLDDLLNEFRLKKTHMAIVVDEYGGTAGLVTLEDVLEEIVGDIRDEHDEAEEDLYEQLGPDTYRFDARVDLDEVNDLLGLDLDTATFGFETLGGLVFHATGFIPSEGDEAAFGPLHMKVESVENHRIRQVLVRIEPRPIGTPDADASEAA